MRRTSGAPFRLLLALVFGFMSLGHSPVMAFAKVHAAPPAAAVANDPAFADAAIADAAMPHAAAIGHAAHHAQSPHHGGVVPTPPGVPPCDASGCFVVVSPAAPGAPTLFLRLIDKVGAHPAHAVKPAVPDPLDPPPRLQA
jgi:hypothetical protein